MPRLNLVTLKNIKLPTDVVVGSLADRPEKVMQFGEGNFLRAFVEWMFQKLEQAGKFSGKVVVVQPIENGMADELNAQDGLYTLLLRGLKDGKPIEQREIITNISRAINAYTDWAEVVKTFCSPDLEFFVSNTTEAGIVFDAEDSLAATPPNSYPAKLTALLYERYKNLQGAKDKGLVIIPCELIEDNGKNLRKIVLQLCAKWSLPKEFVAWVENCNTFVSTLVDRVVTGYPRDEITEICQSLGYEDKLVVTGELYHLWVIEGPKELAKKLPFVEAGLNIIWTEDQRRYRDRKVRILNGGHTTGIPVSYQYGLSTVKEMMDDPVTGDFVRKAIYEEILAGMTDDQQAIKELADEVVNRFCNPYIKHYLLSILLNSSSKYRARVLPSVIDFQAKHGVLPKRLTFALASLLNIYRIGAFQNKDFICKTDDDREFTMQDDASTLEKFAALWQQYKEKTHSLGETVVALLGAEEVWGQNLNNIPQLSEKIEEYLQKLIDYGIIKTLKKL